MISKELTDLDSRKLKNEDAVVAGKGLELQINIPPFLKDKVGFEAGDVIKTQTVERANGKVRQFRIFHSLIPVTVLGNINQM